MSSDGVNDAGGLVLEVSAREARLVPEESALFDVVLSNAGPAPRTALDVDGNRDTPRTQVLDSRGEVLFSGDGAAFEQRVLGDMGVTELEAPVTVDLAPGARSATALNLWKYGEPAPPGAYAVVVEHDLARGGQRLVSRRVPFEIVPAEVLACAHGYESPARMGSYLAWSVLRAGESSAALLVRLSGSSHQALFQGATLHGRVPAGARIALSQPGARAPSEWLGWVAALAPDGHVRLVRHDMTFASWETTVRLPLAGGVPVPRFPDRGHAVFLATGTQAGAPVLVGARASEDGDAPVVWSVPLPFQASAAACAFEAEGDIALLLASDEGPESRLVRVEVDEQGRLRGEPRVVLTTRARIVALAADMRRRAPLGFVALLADRASATRVAVARVAAAALTLDPPEPASIHGWPEAPGAARRPLALVSALVEVLNDGSVALGFVDERGVFHAGTESGGVHNVLGNAPARCPHIAALHQATTISAFGADGVLRHAPWGKR